MSKTYAIADLHGRLDLLEMALAQIANHAELPATLVTLGDYVDRGPDQPEGYRAADGRLGRRSARDSGSAWPADTGLAERNWLELIDARAELSCQYRPAIGSTISWTDW
jgi:Calcineurin-like phosphoesterase